MKTNNRDLPFRCRKNKTTSKYGVSPVHAPEHPPDWNRFAQIWGHSQGLNEGLLVLARGPYQDRQSLNHRLEIIDLRHAHVSNQPPLHAQPGIDLSAVPALQNEN